MSGKLEQEKQVAVSAMDRIFHFNTHTRKNQRSFEIDLQANKVHKHDFDPNHYLAAVQIDFVGQIKVSHPTNTTYTASPLAPYSLVQRIQLETNSSFIPYDLSGEDAYLLERCSMNSYLHETEKSATNTFKNNTLSSLGLQSSPTGTLNTVRFSVEVPLSPNKRDPVGFLQLQNRETKATLKISMADAIAAISPLNRAGYTVELVGMKAILTNTMFQIPPYPQAQLDLSMLRIVSSTEVDLNATGQKDLEIQTGRTYRRVLVAVRDANGLLVANTAIGDYFGLRYQDHNEPYYVQRDALRTMNMRQYGNPLPEGVFCFDFTDQGFVNYGIQRDFVDSQRLTMFLLKMTTKVSNLRCTIIGDTLAKAGG